MAKQGQGQVCLIGLQVDLVFIVKCNPLILSIFSIVSLTTFHQVLVCAPSNVAVDQLAEKISATGLKVRHHHLSLSPSAG